MHTIRCPPHAIAKLPVYSGMSILIAEYLTGYLIENAARWQKYNIL
jgi:hypothetical protein